MEDQTQQQSTFDARLEQEWAGYQVALGDHLAKLPEAERYEVRSPDQYDVPLIVVTRQEQQSMFHLTAPVLATEQSNLPLNATRRKQLKRLGIGTQASTFEWQLAKGDLHLADHIAWVAVQLLRTIYDVPSPALLDADALTITAPQELQMDRPAFEASSPVHTKGPRELADAVEQTLEQVAPHLAHRNENFFRIGDEEGAIRVRVDENPQLIWVFTTPVRVRATSTATREVALLNRDAHFGRYYLKDGWLIAEVRLLANPFVPQHLMDTLTGLLDETRGLAQDFAWRTHGTVLDA
ncbi:hypothetical protein V3G39_17820 (plasmid) [Dermatophilaceae bacterium Sec6.4]